MCHKYSILNIYFIVLFLINWASYMFLLCKHTRVVACMRVWCRNLRKYFFVDIWWHAICSMCLCIIGWYATPTAHLYCIYRWCDLRIMCAETVFPWIVILEILFQFRYSYLSWILEPIEIRSIIEKLFILLIIIPHFIFYW